MKRVLIITYYWPPSGGAGVQRWLKFVKYLRLNGWEPVIYTPENPEAPALDETLNSDIPGNLEVLKTSIWEPYSLYKYFVGKNPNEKIKAGFLSNKKRPELLEKISVWIRGNLFIPDARKYWIRPSIKYLTEYLEKNPVDAIVSTGPPHSMHLIAMGIKKKLNINWLADFRDPWTNIDFYDKLLLTNWADKKNRRYERAVLKTADKVTTISWQMAEEFKILGAKDVTVITNGYDPDDFEDINQEFSEQFEFCHIGALNQDRNPEKLWEVFEDLCNNVDGLKEDLKITFIGFTDYSLHESLVRHKLEDMVEMIDYIPHKEVIDQASSAGVLLLLLNNTQNVTGIVPGKLFEYLALKKPILCIGPENGDAARIIRETRSGSVVDFEDVEKLKQVIVYYYKLYKSGDLKTLNIEIEQYSRKSLTNDMAKVLNQLNDYIIAE